jgi:hypothetical protein
MVLARFTLVKLLLLLLDLLPVLLPTLSAYAGLSLYGLIPVIISFCLGRLLTRGSLRGTLGCMSYTTTVCHLRFAY